MEGENCIRRLVPINSESYYLILGRTFCFATVPFENRPDRPGAGEAYRRIGLRRTDGDDGGTGAEIYGERWYLCGG